MLKIMFICVGKIKDKWLLQGIAEYRKRISRFATLSIVEVPDQPDHIPLERALASEAEAIRKRMSNRGLTIALDLNGAMPDSIELAKMVQNWSDQSQGQLTFIIGGSRGLDPTLLASCDRSWCLSPLTFPHTLTRLIALEQLYRSFKLAKGEKYHK